jgi:GT2 family glycosyltransferase
MLKLKSYGVKLISATSNNPTCDLPALKAESAVLGENENEEYILEPTEYLPLYCVLCHRDLFKHIGGFIKHYPYAGYEDRELAARMRYYGFLQAVCRKSWVYHEGDATLQYLRRKNPQTTQIMKNNRKLYMDDLKKYAG